MSIEEIKHHAVELAKIFEEYEPRPEDEVCPEGVAVFRAAVRAKSVDDPDLVAAVQAARSSGMSWDDLGRLLGRSGDAVKSWVPKA